MVPTRPPSPASPPQLSYFTQRPSADAQWPDGVDLFLDASVTTGDSITQTEDGFVFEVHLSEPRGAKLQFRCPDAAEAQEWSHCIALNLRALQQVRPCCIPHTPCPTSAPQGNVRSRRIPRPSRATFAGAGHHARRARRG